MKMFHFFGATLYILSVGRRVICCGTVYCK